MPAYPGNGLAPLLYENQQAFAWNNEALAVGALSTAVQLRRERGSFYPNGFSVELLFSATPGTYEIDVMGADTDVAGYYVPIGQINYVNSVGSLYVARAEFPSAWVKYVALYVRTWPNAVNVTAKITR